MRVDQECSNVPMGLAANGIGSRARSEAMPQTPDRDTEEQKQTKEAR